MLRASGHRKRRVTEIARLLAVVLFVAAIVDFGYNASQRPTSRSYSDPITGERRWDAGEYRYPKRHPFEVTAADDALLHMQGDAAVTLLALAVVLGTSVKLSKIPRRKKRIVFGVEAEGTLCRERNCEWQRETKRTVGALHKPLCLCGWVPPTPVLLPARMVTAVCACPCSLCHRTTQLPRSGIGLPTRD